MDSENTAHVYLYKRCFYNNLINREKESIMMHTQHIHYVLIQLTAMNKEIKGKF
jgi:hypothetical protein